MMIKVIAKPKNTLAKSGGVLYYDWAAQFYARGGSDEAIYNVNQTELDLYTTGVDVLYQ